jgi:hypothetical protein
MYTENLYGVDNKLKRIRTEVFGLRINVGIVAHRAELPQRVSATKQKEEEGRSIPKMSACAHAREQSVHVIDISPRKRLKIYF